MITEDYVSLETAKLLKEKGFDAYGDGSYGSGIEIYKEYSPVGKLNSCATSKPNKKACPAPTLQMAMKWLREVHNIDIAIYAENAFLGKRYSASIWKDITKRDEKDGAIIVAGAITYEEAAEASIKYCLENLL